MIELIRSFIDTFTAIVQFVAHAIVSLLTLIRHLPTYIAFIATSLDVLPDAVIPFALASVSVYVVFLILANK